MDRDELLAELSADVLTYVMHGSIPEEHVAAEIKPTGLDERFDDFESLVRLHFVLRPAVVDFVEALPERLRSVKTQTENRSKTVRGAIDGRIDWHSTVTRRYSTNPRDRSLFVCTSRSENYDIDENIVLKRLLSVIYTTLIDCQKYLEQDYDWVTQRWTESVDLIETMRRIVERNVHVTRIREPKTYEPTGRMFDSAAASRSQVYREGARLLEEYEASRTGDEDAIRELIDETAITPDDDETLLELFVLFKYIDAVERVTDSEFSLRTIETGSQEVAALGTTDATVTLYHNSSASDRDLSFLPVEHEREESELGRLEHVQRETDEVEATYFRTEKSKRRTGRPDVIVLEVDTENRHEYLITEIKNSTNPKTVRSGIKETLEYLAFLRRDEEFVYGTDEKNYFGTGWNGVLVVQDFDGVETASLDEQRSIKILQASEVEAKLEEVIRTVL